MRVTWYLHAVEDDDGQWSCQHGRETYDTHVDRESAVAHLKRIALTLGAGAVIFVHAVNEVVERIT